MLAIVLLLLVVVVELQGVEISCETIGLFNLSEKWCFLNGTTAISQENVTIGGLENFFVSAILFDDNKKIEFLPVGVKNKFPVLQAYYARNAFIKKVLALNLEGLLKLRFLDLSWNEIEVIPDDCFRGLSQLRKIELAHNKIKTVNGIAFANLPGLISIDLKNNKCISSTFEIEKSWSEIRRKITRRCGSADPTRKQIFCADFPFRESNLTHSSKINQSCLVDPETYIDTPDFIFAKNLKRASCAYLQIYQQLNIEFLPVLVHEQFPNLKVYAVKNAPIRRISKKNFEKLYELKRLHLESNQIEMITSDTFEDLINLEKIQILNQPLVALNGEAFARIRKLEELDLRDNLCIEKISFDRRFQTDSEAIQVYKEITDKCGFDEFDFTDITCERFSDGVFNIEFCKMNEKTVINAPYSVIADLKDEKIGGIIFNENKKIEYLPYKIFMQFPNLVEYKALECSIKQIRKENFEKLVGLKLILLRSNQIQNITGNIFKGLESLEFIDLSRNQIKAINGRLFDQLDSLEYVNLKGNECVDIVAACFARKKQPRVKDYRFLLYGGSHCTKNEPGLYRSLKNFKHTMVEECAFAEFGDGEFDKVFDVDCGVRKGGSGFIVRGKETQRGQWPFMAALMLAPKNTFLCGGSVITTSHVLTAAHCIEWKYTKKPHGAGEFALLLGRHNIISQAEIGSEVRGVKEIKVHPHWNSTDMKYRGDIAVLTMDRSVEFSQFIQPICLTFEPEISQQENGYVVGWGSLGNSAVLHENISHQVLIASVTSDVCFAKDHKLGSMFAEGMFCAGGDGSGPCHGDSGGGYFVRYQGLWTLRGVVSSGTLRDDFTCDVDRYTLFTNAVDYAAWIKEACKKKSTPFTKPMYWAIGDRVYKKNWN